MQHKIFPFASVVVALRIFFLKLFKLVSKELTKELFVNIFYFILFFLKRFYFIFYFDHYDNNDEIFCILEPVWSPFSNTVFNV